MLKPNLPTQGHTAYNDHRPTSHFFESIETGVGNYTWTAFFGLGDVLISEPRWLNDDGELAEVTRPAELRLLEACSRNWREDR